MLEALILSRDPRLISTFRPVLEASGVQLQVSASAEDAVGRFSNHKFDAFVVDCDGVADGADYLISVRKSGWNNSSIVFAVLSGQTTVRQAFSMGCNFVMEKPLTQDFVQRSIRAGLGLMLRERRRYSRCTLDDTTAHFVLHDSQELQVEVTNLSEGGMSVRLSQKNLFRGSLKVRFILPDSQVAIRCKCEVVWSKPNGEAGIKFVELGSATRLELVQWIAKHLDQLPPVPVHSSLLREKRMRSTLVH